MKQNLTILSLLLLLAFAGMAQTTTPTTDPAAPAAVTAPADSAVAGPSMLVGDGVQWQRGAAYPLVNNTHFAKHISGTSWYSWTTVSTPFTKSPAGSPPVSSSLSTGGAYVAAQSSSGAVSLVLIVQAGFATTAAATSAIFSGNVGLAIRPWKTRDLYLFPFVTGQGSAGGSLTSFILQPGISVLYGFGKAK